MQIAFIVEGQIVEIKDIMEAFPNVSFPATGPDNDFLTSNSVMEVIPWLAFDSSIEKLETVEPYIKDGKVYTCVVISKTSDELRIDAENAKIFTEYKVRLQRNQLLKDSDWTQVADAPVDKAAWITYRQALRDLTLQENFPFDVIFPNPPL